MGSPVASADGDVWDRAYGERASKARGISIEQVAFVVLVVAVAYLLLLDGYIRLKTGQPRLTLLRDAAPGALLFLGVAHAGVRPRRRWNIPLSGLVGAWIVVCLVQLLNPDTLSISGGVQALRPHLEFVVFFFAGAVVVRTRPRLEALLLVVVLCSAINGVVGYSQSSLTPEQLAAKGPGYASLAINERNPSTFRDNEGTNRVRPPALGFAGGFAAIVAILGLPAALALSVGSSGLKRVTAVAAIPLIMLGVVTAQTRAGLVTTALAALVFVLLSSRGGGLLRPVAAALLVAGGILFITQGGAFGGLNGDRYESILPTNLTGTFDKERGSSLYILPEYITTYPAGAGLGTSGPGSVAGSSANAGKLSGENEFVYLQTEVGVIGLVVMLALFMATIQLGLRARRATQDAALRMILTAFIGCMFGLSALWFAGPVTTGTASAPFFWLTAGVFAGSWQRVHELEGTRSANPGPSLCT
jgi:hypothetical protein